MTSIISYGTQCRFEYDSKHSYDSVYDYDEEEYTPEYDDEDECSYGRDNDRESWIYFDPRYETCGDYSCNDGDYSPDTPSDTQNNARFSLLHSIHRIPITTYHTPSFTYHTPFQLPPEGSKFSSMKEHLEDVVRQVEIEFENKATLKLLAEEAVAEKHRRFMAKLPTEPAIKTHRRKFAAVVKDIVLTYAAKIIQKKIYRANKGWFEYRTYKFYKKKSRNEWLDRCEKKDKSSNVWGHRRNGGGKGKKVELSALTEKDKKEAAERRSIRRANTKEKKEEEERKKEEARLEREERAMFNVVVEEAPVVAEPVEETEAQRLTRERFEYMRSIVRENLLKKQKEDEEEQKRQAELQEELDEVSCLVKGYKKQTSVSKVVFPTHAPVKTFKVSDSDSGDWCEIRKSNKILDLSHTMATTSEEEKNSISKNALHSHNLKKPKKSSRMCKFVLDKLPCKHGDNCRFAHSLAEIKIECCKKGDDCMFIRKNGNKYINGADGRKCFFRHRGETDDDFYIRHGYKAAPAPEKVPLVCKPVFTPAPVPVSNPWKVEEKKPRVSRWGPPLEKKVEVEEKKPRVSRWGPPLEKKVEVEEQVTVIRAPKEIVMKLYTVALNAGRKNIRIIVTN